MRCNNCGTEQFVPGQLRKTSSCSGCRINLTSCENCQIGPFCLSCQIKNDNKIYNNGLEYYYQLKEIASTLNIPLNNLQSYNLTDAKWSSFFPSQVKTKWNQLKTTQLSPQAHQSELLSENKSLTTALTLKDRELKDLQAEIRALESKLTESENSSPHQIRINKLERKLNLVHTKLQQWTNLLTKTNL